MSKFKTGDRIIQDTSGMLATVIRQEDRHDREGYIINLENSHLAGEAWLHNLVVWSLLEEEEEPLPEMPNSVIYRSTAHELEVAPEDTLLGDVFIGFRRQDTDEIFRGLHLTADEALGLSHDILRYAMQAKRRNKEV